MALGAVLAIAVGAPLAVCLLALNTSTPRCSSDDTLWVGEPGRAYCWVQVMSPTPTNSSQGRVTDTEWGVQFGLSIPIMVGGELLNISVTEAPNEVVRGGLAEAAYGGIVWSSCDGTFGTADWTCQPTNSSAPLWLTPDGIAGVTFASGVGCPNGEGLCPATLLTLLVAD